LVSNFCDPYVLKHRELRALQFFNFMQTFLILFSFLQFFSSFYNDLTISVV